MRMNCITFNINASAKFHVEQRQLDTKEHTRYSYTKFKIRKTHLWFQKSGEWWLSGGEVDSGRVAKGLLGNSNILFLGLGPGYISEFAL